MMSSVGELQTSKTSANAVPLEQRLRRRHRELLAVFDESKITRTQQNDASAADRLVSLRTDLSNHRMNSETKIVNSNRQSEAALKKLDACCISTAFSAPITTAANNNNNINRSISSTATSTPIPNQGHHAASDLLPFGPDERLPQDDIHGGPQNSKPENYEQVLAERRDRITTARLEIIQLAMDLRNEHQFRMSKIDSLEKALFDFEQQRQSETEKMTRELVENIISIAYVNVTQAQSIAQQYLIEENERSLANNVGMTSLFSKLRQHELLHFRELMKSVRTSMRKTEERCVKSILVWTMNLLLSRRFREPKGRADLIEKTRAMVLQSGRNLKHIVGSITAAAESLPRKPRPTAKVVSLVEVYSIALPLSQDQVPCDIPGGSGDGGWLKHFMLDDPRALRPFNKNPNQVTLEWTQALETVLDHFGTKSEEIILDSQRHGQMINDMVQEILLAMKRDVAHCFVLGPVEIQMKKKQSNEFFPLLEDLTSSHVINNNNNNISQTTHDSSTPLPGVVSNENNNNSNSSFTNALLLLPSSEQSKEEFSFSLPIFVENIERSQKEIKMETKWFSDFLSLHLLRQYQLANNLIHRNGFYSLCTEATAFLQGIVETISNLVRSAVLWQEESQKDFRDTLTRLEKAYQVTEDRLASAGTISEATDLCEQAASLLKKIEDEYVGNYGRSEEYLQNLFLAKNLPQLFDEQAQKVFTSVSVSPVDLKKLQREEFEYVNEQQKAKQAADLLIEEQKRKRSSSPAKNNSPTANAAAAAANANAKKHSVVSPVKGGRPTTGSLNAAAAEQAKKEAAIAERQRLLKLPSVASVRGATYIITAPVENVMELGGSQDAFLAEQIEDNVLVEEKKKEAVAAAAVAANNNAERQQQIGIRRNSNANNNNAKSVKGGKPTKMTKEQKEELERLEQEELARKEQEAATKRLLPVEEKYIGFLTREFSNIFTPNCLLPASSLQAYILLLRSLVLDWFEEYRDNIFNVSRAYTKTTIDQLSLETHECIRRHARRPVTLQSQVFEVRIRQLQDAADARAEWFRGLLLRINRGLEHAQRGIADLEVVESSTSSSIEDIKEEVCEASNVAAIDAQNRRFIALLSDNSANIKNSLEGIKKKAFDTFRIVQSEVESFEIHKLKSLTEGGTLTPAEKEICVKTVKDIYDRIKLSESDVSNLSEQSLVQWRNKCSSWQKEFDELLDLHRKEVTFLREIGEALSKARGAISVMLSASSGSHVRLGNAVDSLELFASGGNNNNNNNISGEFQVPPRGENFSQIKSVQEFSKMSFAVSSSASSTTSSAATTSDKQKQQSQQSIYENTNSSADSLSSSASTSSPIPTQDRINQSLRQLKILREKQLCFDSRAAKLSQLISTLRDLFCERGLSLGCLANLPEWGLTVIPKDWLSLEATKTFMQNNMNLLGIADLVTNNNNTNENQAQNNNNSNVKQSSARPGTLPNNNNNAKSVNPAGKSNINAAADFSPSSIRNAIGAVLVSELPSTDVLLPPMRSTTTRLEWVAQRILDKAERDIHRLVAAHFSRPVTTESIALLANDDDAGGAGGKSKNSSNAAASTSVTAGSKAKKEKEAAAALAAQLAEQEALAAANRLTRDTEFGQDANSIKERVSKLLIDQLGRVTDHVEENTNDYRVLVRKLQVSIHGAVEELFTSLLQFQLGTLNESIQIILDDFAFFYRRILEEQRQIQQNLRAPLASPSHAKEWNALCRREAARRTAAKYELQQVAANFATEIIQSERVANARVAQALACFFSLTRSFVLIRHLEGGDAQIPEAGKHRGLRRLLRIKLREEAGGPKIVAEGADDLNNNNNNNDPKNRKKNQMQKTLGGATSQQQGNGVGSKGRNAGAAQQQQDNYNNLNNNNNHEVADPVPPPPLQPQVQIVPIALTGLNLGRTILPAQKPVEEISGATIPSINLGSAIAASNINNAGNLSKQQQKELAVLIQQQQQEAAAAAKKKKEEEEAITRIFMTVASEPASWFDESSQSIFKMLVTASLVQRKEQLELEQQQQQQQSALNNNNNLDASASPSNHNKSNIRGGAATNNNNNTSSRGANNNNNRGGGPNAPITDASANNGNNVDQILGKREFFDPSIPFKTPNYAAPASATSTVTTVTVPSTGVVVPLPTPSETRIFPVAYSSAQLTIDKMDQLVSDAAEMLYATLKQFEDVEERWVVSWNGAVETLGAASNIATNKNKNNNEVQAQIQQAAGNNNNKSVNNINNNKAVVPKLPKGK